MINPFEGVGIGVALVTPFNEDLSIDFAGLKNLLNHVSEGNADYLVVMGTTGESATLEQEEKKEILKFVLENNPKNLPIVYGIGGNNTAHVVKEIKNTDLTGVSAILSVCPYYNKPSQQGVINHYTLLANESELPIIIYNVPGRSGININSSSTLVLANHANIIGIKEASPIMDQAIEIASAKPEDFFIISGDDMTTLPFLSIGGLGVISVLANAYPKHFNNILSNFNSGNLAKARDYAYQLVNIHPLMYTEGNPSGLKFLLSELGICKPFVRMPLATISEELQKKIEEAMPESI